MLFVKKLSFTPKNAHCSDCNFQTHTAKNLSLNLMFSHFFVKNLLKSDQITPLKCIQLLFLKSDVLTCPDVCQFKNYTFSNGILMKFCEIIFFPNFLAKLGPGSTNVWNLILNFTILLKKWRITSRIIIATKKQPSSSLMNKKHIEPY